MLWQDRHSADSVGRGQRRSAAGSYQRQQPVPSPTRRTSRVTPLVADSSSGECVNTSYWASNGSSRMIAASLLRIEGQGRHYRGVTPTTFRAEVRGRMIAN